MSASLPLAARDFVVLHAAEFVVLDPKVGLENFQSRWKPKQCRVSPVIDVELVFFGSDPANSPAPIVPAPRANHLLRKARRLMKGFRGLEFLSNLSLEADLRANRVICCMIIRCFHDSNIAAPNGLGCSGKVTRLLPVEPW